MPRYQCASPETEPYAGAPYGIMSISNQEFRLIRSLVYEKFGISLGDHKQSLVVGRLQKLVRSHGFVTFRQYYDYLCADSTGKALNELINRISTNHTFFFRESDHFDFFSNRALPEIIASLKKTNCRDLRIWCAASSSGEEPYSLVMMMLEYFGNEYGLWNAGVLATDISEKALNKALSGVYATERLDHVPAPFRQRYFVNRENSAHEIADRVKKEVTFRRFNLMNERFPFKKPFHAIFCRNVMIYFDQETRDKLVQKLYDHTVPGGYLFIGHSESIRTSQVPYEPVAPAVYRKIEGRSR
ncbi:MAG: protein-glutamate O-methyltransferase CheR [Pseudomonadota bacterium]